jgi:Pyruvate/2-oxoacid:ferredoxin oxidoreductase delta subunit
MNFLTYFKVPEVAKSMVNLLVTDKEKEIIETIKNNSYSINKLSTLIENKFKENGEAVVNKMYKRALLNKIEVEGEIHFKISEFYDRIAYFCQYETDLWLSVDKKIRDKIDEWYVNVYAESAKLRLEDMLQGKRELIENAYFFTLQETLDLIDSIDKQIYVVPCNCKAVAQKCLKPKEVCLLFETGINSSWDRGYGQPLTKEEAKAIVIEADKNGLMHTSETDHAICNCCGCCCYPIRASKIIGTTGIWPKRRYDVLWNESKCISCGKCVKACNFQAFIKNNKKVEFHEERCLGCTICSSHCTVNAITLRKREG